MKKPVGRDLRQQIDAFTKKLGAELASIIGEHVDAMLEDAHAVAVRQVKALAMETDALAATKRIVVPKPTKIAAQPAPQSTTTKVLTCGKCQQPGHNARSCGRAPKGNSHGAKTIAPHVAKSKPWAAALARTREARKTLDTYEGDE